MPITVFPVSGESTTHATFSGGFATVDINLQGYTTNSSAVLDLPRNVTVTSSTVQISYDADDKSPGAVWVDVNQDGVLEWEYDGVGYGDLGEQTEFYDGNSTFSASVTPGKTPTPSFLFPSVGQLQGTGIDASFSPNAGGGFFAVGEYQQVIKTDIDKDGNPEPVFLSSIQSNNSTSIFWADWDIVNGTNMKPAIQTCDNASSISVGDINGDGNEDIVAFSSTSGSACIHLANGSSFDPIKNETVGFGMLKGTLGDLNNDGIKEIISITSSGNLQHQSWDNSTGSLTTITAQQINRNGSIGTPAALVSVYSEDFFGTGNESVLVKDDLGHWTMWQLFSGSWGGPLLMFDDIQFDEIFADLDNDGDIDILGSGDMGNSLRVNNGTSWNLVELQSQIDLTNSTIADFDGNGVLEIMIPQAGTSDGNSSTIEGSIILRSVNETNISSPSSLILQPWSLPNSVITMDMDGDGVIEQVISAGEMSLGVFIGGWHTIGLDSNNDGIPEITSTGYAGDSTNGIGSLDVIDDNNFILSNLSGIVSGQTAIPDPYGISMSNISMNFTSSGSGTVDYSGLYLSYDCEFTIDTNPSISFNLTNSLNQLMTGGVGNISIPIPVNSTDSGKVSLTNLFITTVQGAPNFSTPVTPAPFVLSINSTQVEIAWNPVTDYGEDLAAFEIFRIESVGQSINLNMPYNYSNTNHTLDDFVTPGSTYYYAVRSVHDFGITSNLSNLLEVTIPYPSPPAPISGLVVSDVIQDQGGSLEISWDPSQDEFSYYELYLENNTFNNISSLVALLTISSDKNSTIVDDLTDGQEYWVAVVAVNEFGNKTQDVTSVGPTYTRNDDPLDVLLALSVSQSISLGSPFALGITANVDGQEIIPPGDILIEMETNTGTYPISTNWENISHSDFADLISFAGQISGDVIFWANYSGDDGDELNRPISASSVSASSFVTVGAILSSAEQIYELDWENETSVRVDLTAINSTQQSMLEGASFTWVAHNETSGNQSSGNGIIENGFHQFVVSFNESGTLYVNLTSPAWIGGGSNTLQLSLVTYGSTVENNQTEENQTTETPWAPTTMLNVILDCGDVIIDPSEDQELNCTITNPNNYSIEISLEADGWSEWSEYILFEPPSGQSDFTLAGSESKNLEIRVDIIQNLRDNMLSSGLIQVDLRQGPANYTSPGDRPQTIEIQWTLIEETIVVEPNPQQNNTNQTVDTNDSSSSDNTMLILGGVVGLAVIGLVVFIVLRMRNSDFEDWDEDDLDMEPDIIAAQRVSKPLPVGVALDEFEDKTIVDETPDRPDVINEFDDSDDYIQDSADTSEEYAEEEYSEYEESDDSGVSVDEHGTEWYEDEVGVWWYREEGQEDWSEFVEE